MKKKKKLEMSLKEIIPNSFNYSSGVTCVMHLVANILISLLKYGSSPWQINVKLT